MEDPSARVLRPNSRATYIAEDGSDSEESLTEELSAWISANPRRAERLFRNTWSSKYSSTGCPVAHHISYGNLVMIKKAWIREFVGGAITSFTRIVDHAEQNFCDDNDYAKFKPVVQSSGAGKSRLIDEYSRLAVGIIFYGGL